ncbi:MAG: vancomycin high temperature exclusion protein [Spirochaetaceae bacterium]
MGKILYVLFFFLRHAALGSIILIFLSNTLVVQQSEGSIYRDLATVPPTRVALLLGTSRWVRGGRANPFFDNRVAAAARLYETDKVEFILASGDNSHPSYNEPAYLRAALLRSGVPEERVVLDYAGFSTLDSVVRAREVFGLESVLVVSQPFHLQRALFIADAAGLDAVGYAAADVEEWAGVSVRLRESLARVKAVLDVYVFHRSPRYLGELELIE